MDWDDCYMKTSPCVFVEDLYCTIRVTYNELY